MKRIILILVFGLLLQAPAFSQGYVLFGIDFNGNPPPHSDGVPDSGAYLTNDLFYAILYLSQTEPTSASILEKSAGGSFTTVFDFTKLVFAGYPGGGVALDYENSWQLTQSQIDALLAGQWYAQVNYGNTTYLGEITPVPEPSSIALLAIGLGLVGTASWRRLRPEPS